MNMSEQNDLEQDIRELERRGLIERCFRDGEEVVELTAMGREAVRVRTWELGSPAQNRPGPSTETGSNQHKEAHEDP